MDGDVALSWRLGFGWGHSEVYVYAFHSLVGGSDVISA